MRQGTLLQSVIYCKFNDKASLLYRFLHQPPFPRPPTEGKGRELWNLHLAQCRGSNVRVLSDQDIRNR